MTRLNFLALHDCNSITNNGMTSISALTSLNTLSLRGCRKLTNNGMGTIKVCAHFLCLLSFLHHQHSAHDPVCCPARAAPRLAAATALYQSLGCPNRASVVPVLNTHPDSTLCAISAPRVRRSSPT